MGYARKPASSEATSKATKKGGSTVSKSTYTQPSSDQLIEALFGSLNKICGDKRDGGTWTGAKLPGIIKSVHVEGDGEAKKYTRKILVVRDKDGNEKEAQLVMFLRTYNHTLQVSFEIGGQQYEVDTGVVVK